MDDFGLSYFDPAAAVTKLKALKLFVSVGGARDLGNARTETLRAPCAWVIVMGEVAGQNRYESCDVIEQLITLRFGVVLAVRDLGDRTGSHARENLKPLREALHRALCAWVPVGANSACRFTRGALTSGIGRDGMMFWQDEFEVTFDRRLKLGG